MSGQFIEAVLFAEFDIDKGSVLRLQYPEKVSDDEGLLAELMLPEGAHNHFQDWTVFMLNRPSQEPPEPARPTVKRWPVHAYQYNLELDPPEWVLASGADTGTTHWVWIDAPPTPAGGMPQPPVLQIDLEKDQRIRMQHHDELQYSALQADFASMYSFDGEALGLHFRSGEQQEEFKAALDAAAAALTKPPGASMLWCLNHVSNRRDKTVRRGAQVKALAVCSRFQFIHVWKPLLLLAVDRLYSLSTGLGEYSEAPREQCKYLFEALNALPVSSLPPVSDLQRQTHRLMLAQGTAQKELTHVGHVQWLTSQIPMRIPLLLQPQELADTSLTELLRRFKGGLMVAFHALLNRQRLLFLGHSQPAETVCTAVLSVPLLVCPPSTDVLPRCFPYTTLNNLDFLNVKGYVAGSTNPIFESHPEWWDVLMDIDSGKVLVSGSGANGKPSSSEPPKLSEMDAELMEQVSSGIEAHYSEYWLRSCFQEHAQQLICARRRSAVADQPKRGGEIVPSAELVAHHLEQLRAGAKLGDAEMLAIFTDLNEYVKEEARLVQLLAMVPGSSPLGCLAPVSGALFHPLPKVRTLAAKLLAVLDQFKAAKPCVSGLNTFLLLGYDCAREGAS